MVYGTTMTYYPNNHPAIKDHLVTFTLPNGAVQEMVNREVYESVLKERDDYNRALALISAFIFQQDDIHPFVERQFNRVGHTRESAEAMANIVASVQNGSL